MSDLRERRLNLVHALESGEYNQGDGALCTYQGADEYNFCCLGVGRDVINPGYLVSSVNEVIEDLSWDEQYDYEVVREHYGIDTDLEQFLICFNDGDKPYINGKWRKRRQQRDFKFIARFLRKVWMLGVD